MPSTWRHLWKSSWYILESGHREWFNDTVYPATARTLQFRPSVMKLSDFRDRGEASIVRLHKGESFLVNSHRCRRSMPHSSRASDQRVMSFNLTAAPSSQLNVQGLCSQQDLLLIFVGCASKADTQDSRHSVGASTWHSRLNEYALSDSGHGNRGERA